VHAIFLHIEHALNGLTRREISGGGVGAGLEEEGYMRLINDPP
jgi:hypothetical protein